MTHIFFMTRLKKDDAWCETAMTREKMSKKHCGDASIKQHDAATRDAPIKICRVSTSVKLSESKEERLQEINKIVLSL